MYLARRPASATCAVLATSLFDHAAARLYEHDSARVCEHDAVLRSSIVCRSSPLSRSFVLASLRALHLDSGSGTAGTGSYEGQR